MFFFVKMGFSWYIYRRISTLIRSIQWNLYLTSYVQECYLKFKCQMSKKNQQIEVLGRSITIDTENFISLTDMLKAKDGEFFISDWLRNRNTLEYMGIWERIHNPDFNYGEFAIIKSQSGLNSYKISVKEWVEKTRAIGIRAKAGRYGGTYAHQDLAFEFGMWISAEFKIYLVKEFQRLKEDEQKTLDWNVKRSLTKINYRIHTDAVKSHLIPLHLSNQQISLVYAHEADVLIWHFTE